MAPSSPKDQGGGSAPRSLPVPCRGARGCRQASLGTLRQDELMQLVLETRGKRGHPPPPRAACPPSPKPFPWGCLCLVPLGRASRWSSGPMAHAAWYQCLYLWPSRMGNVGMLLCPPSRGNVQRKILFLETWCPWD